MSKRPAFQFYTGDWLKDPQLRMCAPATRGIWMDLICAMWENDESGEMTGTVVQLARAVGCFPDEMEEALYDLAETGAADVFACDMSVTRHAKVRESHAVVTVINRRMSRDGKERENAALRKQRSRRRAAGHGNVTENSRSLSSFSTSVTGTDVPVHDDERDILDRGTDLVREKCQLSLHVAQTYIANLCKLHGTRAVIGALRQLLVTPVAEPRSWLRAALEKSDGTHRPSGPPSAVDRVRAAAAEREAAAGSSD